MTNKEKIREASLQTDTPGRKQYYLAASQVVAMDNKQTHQ